MQRIVTVVGMPTKVESFLAPLAAATFMLNMQLGSGVLLLPLAFTDAGLALATIFLLIVCGAAFISASWVIEAMAIGNHKYKQELDLGVPQRLDNPLLAEADRLPLQQEVDDGGGEGYDDDGRGDNDDDASAVQKKHGKKNAEPDSTFTLTYRIEMGALAQTFFPMWGRVRACSCTKHPPERRLIDCPALPRCVASRQWLLRCRVLAAALPNRSMPQPGQHDPPSHAC